MINNSWAEHYASLPLGCSHVTGQ